jgi:Uma2 family endonuclease
MVTGVSRAPRRFTPIEYLDMERAAENKSEYLDGQIYAMAGASPTHNTIAMNLAGDVVTQLRGRECQAFGSDLKVRIPSECLFTYPDLIIVCGEPRYHDEIGDVLLNPTVLVEILSPSTEAYDRGAKFDRYEQIETFTDYLLISQSEPRIEHWTRVGGGKWIRSVSKELDSEIEITSVGCTLKLRDVYDRVKFSNPNEQGEAVS